VTFAGMEGRMRRRGFVRGVGMALGCVSSGEEVTRLRFAVQTGDVVDDLAISSDGK